MVPRLACTVAILPLLFLVPSGCKKDGDKAGPIGSASADLAVKGPRASCNLLDEQGTCTEYARVGQPVEKTLCEGLKGRWSTTACPPENRVGACTKDDGETKHYYKTFIELRSFTADEAKADCESELTKGKFTPSSGATPTVKPPASGKARPPG